MASDPADGTISSVKELLDSAERATGGVTRHAHLRWWFRGQSDWDWPLHPAVYRTGFPAKNEEERLNTEQHLAQDFRVESAGLRSGPEENSDLYFLQQHYGMPTRLLDWSTSPLAALFFAVASNSSSDGAFYAMDAYQLAVDQDQRGGSFKGIATSKHALLATALRPVFDWKDSTVFPAFIFPVRPNHFDHRFRSQRSCFTFHVPSCPILTSAQNHTMKSFRIPTGVKARLKDELFRLGMDEFAIYGDLESLSKRLKFAYRVGG